jgi:hypothetical protein
VRSVEAELTVRRFEPGRPPRLPESRILRLAKRAAAEDGDASPSLIQHAEGTRFLAVLIGAGGDLVFAWNWSDLIAVRGHFTINDAPGPPGAKPITGTVMTLVVDARTGQATDFGLGNRYPRLARLGPITTDLRSPR